MANLNIRNIDEGLKAEVKAAAMAQMTLGEFCTMIFRSMKFRELGEKIGGYKGVIGGRVDSEKKSDVSATSGEGAEYGRGKNPKRVGRVPEAGSGLPDPGFGTDGEFPEDAAKKARIDALNAPDPVSGPGVVYPLMPMPPAIAKEAGQIMKAAEKIEIPEAAVAFAKYLRDKVEAFTGADPQILNAPEKPHARTLQGAEAAEAHRNAKSKKIAKVPASAVPTPEKSQETKNVPNQAASKETQKNRNKDQSSQLQSPTPLAENQTPAGAGDRLNSHDPKTCKVYGCLMCKAAKEGQ